MFYIRWLMSIMLIVTAVCGRAETQEASRQASIVNHVVIQFVIAVLSFWIINHIVKTAQKSLKSSECWGFDE